MSGIISLQETDERQRETLLYIRDGNYIITKKRLTG